MKNILIIILLWLTFLSLSPVGLNAQPASPPDPGGKPSSQPPLGGSAPIGEGIAIWLGLSLAYASVKISKNRQDY